jgi:hypothetical protein
MGGLGLNLQHSRPHKKEYMISLIFNIVLFALVYLCLWRIADVSNRLEMNIIVVQSLQTKIDELEKNLSR